VVGLAALFATSGVLHFVRPRPFVQIVPRALPRKTELVYVSGAAELVCAAGLLHPRSRPIAGLASAGLLAAVLPANVQMTVDLFRRYSGERAAADPRRAALVKAVAVARLPVQIPLIRIGWRAFRARPVRS